MAKLYVQVLKCLRMVHTSEEPFPYSTTRDSHQGEVCVCVCVCKSDSDKE